MNAFLAALLVAGVIAAGADYLLGGPLFETGGVLLHDSAAATYSSPNVYLD